MKLHPGAPGILVLLALPACFPEFEDRPYLIAEPTVLAVRGTPAETVPNQQVALEALIATPAGTVDGPLTWAFCLEPRRVEERTSVTAACLTGSQLQPIADPTAVPMLADACSKFGPISPPNQNEGEQPRRPSDPDPTGGFFVPVRAEYQPAAGQGARSFGFLRVRCDLAGATRDVFDAYQKGYTNNVNPQVSELLLDGQSVTQLAVTAGATVALALAPGATDREPYLVYSAIESALFDRVEGLTVSWYLTAGTLSRPSQRWSAEELEAGARFETEWEAPSGAATVYGWAILRDDRGGADWRSFELVVP
ncbi:MAG: hypothetical protein H0T89_11040 [Deltaproteobacteria bacterium]|nr:hypothetical protein [Deltaproteobacteria bacterium]